MLFPLLQSLPTALLLDNIYRYIVVLQRTIGALVGAIVDPEVDTT